MVEVGVEVGCVRVGWEVGVEVVCVRVVGRGRCGGEVCEAGW